MNKTERLKLLKLIEEDRIPDSSIGVFLYVYCHAGEVVTANRMCNSLRISKNTLITRLRQLHSSKLITKEKVHRGVIFQVTTSKNWDTSGVLYTTVYAKYKEIAKSILEDINGITRRSQPFKLSQGTLETIGARLNAGYTLADFKQVHQNMKHWLDDDNMSRFYRPQTLYRSNKQFEKYLEEEDAGATRFKDTTSRWEGDDTKQEVEEEMQALEREMEE